MDSKNESIQNLIIATQNGVELKPPKNLPDYSKLFGPIEEKSVEFAIAHEVKHLELINNSTQALLAETIQLKNVTFNQAHEITELRKTILNKEQLATTSKWRDRFIGAFFTIACGLVIYCITNFSKVITFFVKLFS